MVKIVESMKKGFINLVEIVSCGSRAAKENEGEIPKLKVETKLDVTTARGTTTAEKTPPPSAETA